MKNTLLLILFIILYFSLPKTSFSQILGPPIKPDSAYPRFNIVFNPTQFLVGDGSIYAEIQNTPEKLIGASVGYIFPVGTPDYQYFFLTQKYYPLFCYQGIGIRLYEKLYYNQKFLDFAEGKKNYLSPVLLLRYMYYDHLNFSYTDEDEVTWHFVQSEKLWVAGLMLLFGRQTDSRTRLFADEYWGFGVRAHFSTTTLLDEYYVYRGSTVDNHQPVQTTTSVSFYPSIQIGFKIGCVVYKK